MNGLTSEVIDRNDLKVARNKKASIIGIRKNLRLQLLLWNSSDDVTAAEYGPDHNASHYIGALKPESICIYKKLGPGIVVGIQSYFERTAYRRFPSDVEFVLHQKRLAKFNPLEFVGTVPGNRITG